MSLSETIDVRDLRPGMFVQLDLSWIAHPFPLSSFVIGNEAQIDTIRGLGLKRVRWDPSRSELPDTPAPAGAAAQGAQGAAKAPEPVAEDPAEAERRLRRQAVASQRAAQVQCQRCYAESIRGWRDASELLRNGDAEAARTRTESLTSELVRQMLGDPESCIRLLTEGAGDRASAHALNVTVISLLLGRLLSLSEAELLSLGQGALLHDIGKMDLPDRVRYLEEHFTPAEHKLYREHVALGVAYGRRMGLDAASLLVIAQHHEQADGSGFPQRLELSKLSQGARIVALVNRYDNLCNPPLAALALTPHEALSLLYAQGRNKFDPQLLGAFVRMMGVYPPGSVVQLTDERYALVTSVNAGRPLKPRVLVHDARVPREEALVLDLEREPGLGIRRSLKPAQLPREALQYLAPTQRVAYFFDAGPAPLVQERVA
jgi:putative nucleotidyltransferase with HDIG domain